MLEGAGNEWKMIRVADHVDTLRRLLRDVYPRRDVAVIAPSCSARLPTTRNGGWIVKEVSPLPKTSKPGPLNNQRETKPENPFMMVRVLMAEDLSRFGILSLTPDIG